MQTFLTKTSQKKVKLLNYLLEKNQWCTMEELQAKFQVSNKSVMHYISNLAQIFDQYNGEIILKNDNNQRFAVEKDTNFPIFNVYMEFYRESYNYNLIDFMYRHPGKVLEDYAESQFISVSTVFRYAKLLVKYFKRYRLTFQTFKLKLEADEAAIRSFYYYFYWNSTRDGSWPFQTPFSEIEKYVTSFEKTYAISLDLLQRRVFTYWLTISLERSYYEEVEIAEFDQKMILSDPNYHLLEEWAQALKLPFTQKELCFLYRVIYSFGVIDGNRKYENSHAAIHVQHNSLSYRTVKVMEKALKAEFDFDLAVDDQELVYNFVAFHERSRLFFGNTDLFFNRSYISDIKGEEPKYFKKIDNFHKRMLQLADQEVATVLENWEQLFLSYYYVLDYYELLLDYGNPIKVLIQDDVHHTHRLWLMHKISKLYGHSFIFVFYDYQTKLSDVDLVISNYYLDTEDTPLLLMKNIPTQRNWRQLDKMLYKIAKEKS